MFLLLRATVKGIEALKCISTAYDVDHWLRCSPLGGEVLGYIRKGCVGSVCCH